MQTRFIGPMPVDKFLAEFMPAVVARDDNGQPLARPALPFKEAAKKTEDGFIAAIAASGVCPNLRMVNTSTKSDPEYVEDLKPDISVVLSTSTDQLPPMRRMEMTIERKPEDGDPFADPSESDKPNQTRPDFVRKTEIARKNLGQITSYALAQFTAQFRTCCFSILLTGEYARFLRWDRAGTVVTESLNWFKSPDQLAEFFWRFDHMSQEQRGHDVTVRKATEEEADAARAGFAMAKKNGKSYLPDLKLKGTELHTFAVYDEDKKETRYYVGPSAHVRSRSMAGRGTFGYYVWDKSKRQVVYLKDSWRIDVPGMEKEAKIYQRLADAGVRRIAKFGCGGDVKPDQSTRTQEFITADWACSSSNVVKHTHVRLVLETIGSSLENFATTKQLCTAISDALTAHTEAYEKSHVLHRDVSTGNILIDEDGRGFLIDWDLCKDMHAPPQPRRQWRT
ncbi:hypothetical protein FA95DRAFT_685061 [Auriscalpium vulgare]|uniref:Uncharacterized protein n=1 Tax=Auriscalpium vulgare TaxID=40419 RepID=A0ACB8S0Z4_9AGAM|nr:hypothetical protein FA95DRAFT_685061 [Auriscalpium vulgare]